MSPNEFARGFLNCNNKPMRRCMIQIHSLEGEIFFQIEGGNRHIRPKVSSLKEALTYLETTPCPYGIAREQFMKAAAQAIEELKARLAPERSEIHNLTDYDL
jgi:hypothetical protein